MSLYLAGIGKVMTKKDIQDIYDWLTAWYLDAPCFPELDDFPDIEREVLVSEVIAWLLRHWDTIEK